MCTMAMLKILLLKIKTSTQNRSQARINKCISVWTIWEADLMETGRAPLRAPNWNQRRTHVPDYTQKNHRQRSQRTWRQNKITKNSSVNYKHEHYDRVDWGRYQPFWQVALCASQLSCTFIYCRMLVPILPAPLYPKNLGCYISGEKPMFSS